ncbi:hypothetical protein UNSWDHB_1103 [Dehalobacter sp. UNSWDHB]|nr:hypothetical protein DHBDCA_p1215 [Dehalobacter sp. DCA]AFV05286.1 hypothetical protein DCF50_p1280 [Dehalobacter sp. CF]EQB21578.1 hypothetical protein UNSWDHB_1103 [Dehalobacter sp. UNSWDHB]
MTFYYKVFPVNQKYISDGGKRMERVNWTNERTHLPEN